MFILIVVFPEWDICYPRIAYSKSILDPAISNTNVNCDLFWKIYVPDVRNNTDMLF